MASTIKNDGIAGLPSTSWTYVWQPTEHGPMVHRRRLSSVDAVRSPIELTGAEALRLVTSAAARAIGSVQMQARESRFGRTALDEPQLSGVPTRRISALLVADPQVVMPWGGGGMVCTVLASSGVQLAGGQSVANTQVMSDPGCAALGAMSPAHPSRQSCSPIR
jgi:hypothetical protein